MEKLHDRDVDCAIILLYKQTKDTSYGQFISYVPVLCRLAGIPCLDPIPFGAQKQKGICNSSAPW